MRRALPYIFFLLTCGCSTTQVSKGAYSNYWTVTIEHAESASQQAIEYEANNYCHQFSRHATFEVNLNTRNTRFKCE